MPGQETLTLVPRVADGASPAAEVTFTHVRRKPTSRSDMLFVEAVVGQTFVNFEVYEDNPAVPPRAGDRFRDAAGIVYEIRSVTVKCLGAAHDCVCLKDVS